MKSLFESATVKLTAWYLLILAVISIMFSVVVYQISVNEIERRLDYYEKQSEPLWDPLTPHSIASSIRDTQLREAKESVILVLINVNMVVLIIGGIVSYFLARKTLQPIERIHEQQARFISDASHELRTPLTAMITELEVSLRDPSLRKQEMTTLLESNLEEAKRLATLSQTLLALSTNTYANLPFSTFSLSSVIESIVVKLDPTDTRIDTSALRKNLTVEGNQPSIEELVTILLDNALKYSPPSSMVTVSAIRSGHRALVTVTNEGDGIATTDLPRIFDRFYRADTSRSKQDGYGLGLSLAKQISDLHRADLSVASRDGGPTSFTFSLPLVRKSKNS